ncbi:MauE/DoxX family redox-associated membrane protein [Nonomuraea cavernae]|uniref:MauE/DoxX family redox-associated membrane protein n=1 Tax=Nonomuraea cavernae TaxID=2045107 RepID=UPI0033F28BE4
MTYIALLCQGMLTVVFLVSAGSKLRSRARLRAFAISLSTMRLVRDRHVRPVALAIAVGEAVTGALLAVPVTRDAGFAAAAALLMVLTAGVVVVLLRGDAQPCRCFGESSTPLAPRHAVRNVLLGVGALAGFTAPDVLPAAAWTIICLIAGAVAGLFITMLDDLVDLFAGTPAAAEATGSRSPATDPPRSQGAPDGTRRRHDQP